MEAPNVGQEVMLRLAGKLGGIEAASARLGIRATLLQRFIDGLVRVPDATLLKALDLMLDKGPAQELPALQPESPPPKGRPVI